VGVYCIFAQGELPQFASVMATPELGTLTVASAVLKVVTSAMYQRAVSVSPLSLTVPYLAFTPVLLLITAYVINGELPNPQGACALDTDRVCRSDMPLCHLLNEMQRALECVLLRHDCLWGVDETWR